MKSATIILALLFTGYGLYAQSSKTITLLEAINLAITNSKQLAQSQARLEQAQDRVAQARDKAWPEIKVSATYLRINTPNISFKSNSNESGGSGSGSGTSSPLASFANLHDIGLAQVSLSQPIFAGFKIRNTRVMQQYLAEAARYDASTAKSKVATNTARAVFQYYELLQTRTLVEENLRQAQQRVQEFKNLEAQGLLARNDRLKAELQANNIELTRTEVSNNVILAEYNLVLLLGLSENTSLQLDTTGMFKSPPAATWEGYLQKGIENRPELKSSQLQLQAAEASTKVAKASRYPTLALSAGYINAYLPNVLTVTNAINGGLALQYNLTGLVHGNHITQEAKARQREVEASQQLLNDQVRLEIRQKFLSYQQALEKTAVSRRAIEQAEENFSITKNKFNAGLVILSDYLDADVILLQSRINFATARADSMIAHYELEESIGNNQ